jgi:hypothetical protein
MSLVVLAALLCGILLASIALNLVAWVRVRSLADIVRREARDAQQLQDRAIESYGRRLDALAARIEEVGTVPHTAPAVPERNGINLSRRSHALRLHRRGEPPAEIAAALGIPVQEVQLLIKVHEIVMSTV